MARKQKRTYLALCVLALLNAVPGLKHGLLNDSDAVVTTCARIDAFLSHQRCDLLPQVAEFVRALLLADLHFALLQDLQHIQESGEVSEIHIGLLRHPAHLLDDGLDIARAECLLHLVRTRYLAFAHIDKHVCDL